MSVTKKFRQVEGLMLSFKWGLRLVDIFQIKYRVKGGLSELWAFLTYGNHLKMIKNALCFTILLPWLFGDMNGLIREHNMRILSLLFLFWTIFFLFLYVHEMQYTHNMNTHICSLVNRMPKYIHRNIKP